MINRGELLQKLNPYFYVPFFAQEQKRLEASKWPIVKLNSITTKITDGTHFTPTYVYEGIPFLSVKDVREEAISFANTRFITEKQHESYLSRCKPEENDVLLTKIGTIGLAAVIPDGIPEFSIFVSVCLIKPDFSMASPHYLSCFLNSSLADFQYKRNLKGVGVPDLHLENIRIIKIPVPPIKVQERIAEEFKRIFKQKRYQEAQAQALLDSIDVYLLSELGITLPPEPDNTIENRMFKTSWRQVSGGRFDPTFQNVVTEFKSSTYPSRLLREVALINPNTKFKGLLDEDDVTFVPMENISEDGDVDTSQNRTAAGSKGYTTFAENDLLIAKITPCMENGKTGVARNLANQYGYGSTEFHVFRPKSDELNIDFLHALFHANFFRQNAKLTFGGSAGHQRVPPEFFKKMRIPVPPMPIQGEIVHEIIDRQQRAQALRQQAQRDFVEAKQEIERMILG